METNRHQNHDENGEIFVTDVSNAIMVSLLTSEETTEGIPVPKPQPSNTGWVSKLSSSTVSP